MTAFVSWLSIVAGIGAGDTTTVSAVDTLMLLDDPDETMEQMIDATDQDAEEADLFEELHWRQEHKYDLNRITREQLEALPGITPAHANVVMEMRRRVGGFTSVLQLRVLEDGDHIYRMVERYVTVVRKQPGPRSMGPVVQMRNRALRDLQPRRGQTEGAYAGSSLKSYSRLTVSASTDMQAGLLFEKDAGERTGDGFLSGYLHFKNVAGLPEVLVGDYSVEAGQGLVFWRGSAFGKGSAPASVAKKSGLGPRPHRSADEFYFHRGLLSTAGFETGWGNIEITGLYSRKPLSASSDDSTSFTTFYDAGLFRTRGELERRNAVTEQVFGFRTRLVNDGWSVGVSGYNSRFDKERVSTRAYEFTGKTNRVGGVDATVRLNDVQFFGEVARSSGNGLAALLGLSTRIGSATDVAILYRDYGPDFHNRLARGFGESGNTRNERGLYVGASLRISPGVRLSGYLDHFRYPWRTATLPLPVTGNDLLLQSELRPLRTVHLIVRYARKSTNTTAIVRDEFSRDIRPVINRLQHKGRLTMTYHVSPSLRLKGRMEGTSVWYPLRSMHERGYLFYQDVSYKLKSGFAIETRLLFFDTDSFDSRIYEYENDLAGVFSNPALFGKGRRWYALVRFSPLEAVTLAFKYAVTQKEGVRSIGSGMSEIAGDVDNRLAMQVDIRL